MEHTLPLAGTGAQPGETGVVSFEFPQMDGRLRFTYRGKTIAAESTDLFEAFCRIREQLECDGVIPRCYGASLNVFPSGHLRQMYGGLAAYRLQNGRGTTKGDIVDIFDAGPDVTPATVKEQGAFFTQWRP